MNLARYPQETAIILQRDIFWFFLKDEEFVTKTINDSNIDLDKFPVSKVRQLAKKLESSKSTAKHIKQVSHEPQAAKVNLLRHQCTELPHNKFQRKQRKFQPKHANSRNQQENKQYDRINERKSKQIESSDRIKPIQKTDVQDVVIPHGCKVSDILPADINVNTARKLDISVPCASRSHKNKHTRKDHINPKHTNYKLENTLQ